MGPCSRPRVLSMVRNTLSNEQRGRPLPYLMNMLHTDYTKSMCPYRKSLTMKLHLLACTQSLLGTSALGYRCWPWQFSSKVHLAMDNGQGCRNTWWIWCKHIIPRPCNHKGSRLRWSLTYLHAHNRYSVWVRALGLGCCPWSETHLATNNGVGPCNTWWICYKQIIPRPCVHKGNRLQWSCTYLHAHNRCSVPVH